ncbi:hypothetical protein AAG570_005460 [Ranatra chinensis]|uniref:Uncharacterized protein n=1 Tax=Ranatra chinensis TaxID=642074 RepID=A0ABD0XZ78_9HEMI
MGEDFDYSSSNYRKPPAQILLHKQALTKDGNFNFVFTSENGLKQGETIRPDGTRQGGYSYVDPDGNTHTIKYIAGKDGFKILENNAPKAPEVSPQYERILNQHQQIRQQQAQTARDAYDRPITKEYNRPPVTDPFQQQPTQYRVQEESRPQYSGYQEEHKGPHNYGSGYSFEFSG